jgi:uncharacterized protein DUF6941
VTYARADSDPLLACLNGGVMDVDAFLCDHAEVAEGKLFANGAGINICLVPPQPPHVVNLFLAAVVHVPYTATNEGHTLTVSIVDQDGHGMVPWVPEGAPPPGPVVLETEFTVGRPPTLQPGESQPVPVAFGFQGMPVAALGSYSFRLDVDGVEARRLPFRVAPQPLPPGGFGAADIPRL